MLGLSKKGGLVVGILVLAGLIALPPFAGALTQQSGSTGIEGTIPTNPPTQAATIDLPTNGQTFTSLPITVAGHCLNGLLVDIFKNGVFSGSAICANSSYSIKIDLFSGRNDIVAKVYDALNQAGPDSKTVTVTFNDSLPNTGSRPFLTSEFAKRGANPNTELTWPLTLSGGTGPYAISVDWGDKGAPDLISRQSSGTFNIQHTYTQSGQYNVIVKATDANGVAAFLQVVAIANGPIQQNNGSGNTSGTAGTGNNIGGRSSITAAFWIAIAFGLPLLLLAFWLGKKHQLQTIRDRLRRGEQPL